MKINERSLEIAKDFLGKKHFENLNLKIEESGDKNHLEIDKKGNDVLIKAGQLSGVFYSLSILKEKEKEGDFLVSFDKRFNHNGVMNDCSRNGVMNVEQAKQFALVTSLFGLNRFLLYIEDTYEIEGEPYFGYMRGRYSKDELREIDEYASSFGVEVVPCIQTLSHLNQALKWQVYADRRESTQTLLIDEPKTYELIEKMIKTCKENFSTDRIHIGMDEAWDLGLGIFAQKNIAINKTEYFLRHLNKVVEICHKYGLKPMMWEDMFFNLNSSSMSNWYHDTGLLSEDIKKLIPDVGLVYWDYHNRDPKAYDKKFIATLDTGKEAIYAGGAISWIGFAPNITTTLQISGYGLRSAIRNGIKEVFTTSWGDNGAECTAISAYASMALYSLYDYQGKASRAKVSSLLKAVTGDDLKIWTALEQVNKVRKELLPYENPSKGFLYQDTLVGIYDHKAKHEYVAKYAHNTRVLRSAERRSEKFAYAYRTLGDLSHLLEIKVDLGVRIRESYLNNDKDGLRKCASDLKKCVRRLDIFSKSYAYQWQKENKIQGYEVIDGRLGFVRKRMLSAFDRINSYLKGEIKSLPELEEKTLPHDCDDNIEEIAAYNWAFIASANII